MDKFIFDYYRALRNMYVDKVLDFDKYTLVKSNIIDDGIWNFICNLKVDSIEEIQSLLDKTRYEFINKTPRFYVLQNETIASKLDQIKDKYSIYCRDSWFYTKLEDLKLCYKSKLPVEVRISSNKNDIIETIMKGFSTGDPNDPYGDLSPLYRDALKTNLNKSVDGYKSLHYVAYLNNKPVSMATVTIKHDYAFLNNVVTLKEYKGNGIAKEILSYLVNDLKCKKAKYIVFATETGEYTEAFYKKLGFSVVNHGYCFEEKQ